MKFMKCNVWVVLTKLALDQIACSPNLKTYVMCSFGLDEFRLLINMLS